MVARPGITILRHREIEGRKEGKEVRKEGRSVCECSAENHRTLVSAKPTSVYIDA